MKSNVFLLWILCNILSVGSWYQILDLQLWRPLCYWLLPRMLFSSIPLVVSFKTQTLLPQKRVLPPSSLTPGHNYFLLCVPSVNTYLLGCNFYFHPHLLPTREFQGAGSGTITFVCPSTWISTQQVLKAFAEKKTKNPETIILLSFIIMGQAKDDLSICKNVIAGRAFKNYLQFVIIGFLVFETSLDLVI